MVSIWFISPIAFASGPLLLQNMAYNWHTFYLFLGRPLYSLCNVHLMGSGFSSLYQTLPLKWPRVFLSCFWPMGLDKTFTVKKGAQFRELAQRVCNFIARPFSYKVANSLNTLVCVCIVGRPKFLGICLPNFFG